MEAVWLGWLGHWTCNLVVLGSSPPPCYSLDLFVVPPPPQVHLLSCALCKQPTGLPPSSYDFQELYVSFKYLFLSLRIRAYVNEYIHIVKIKFIVIIITPIL